MLVVYSGIMSSFSQMIFSSHPPRLAPHTLLTRIALLLIPCSLFLAPVLHAAGKQPSAQKIVNGVRLASTLQHNDLNGTLRKNGKRIPIGLFLRGENIQFQYLKDKKWKVFHMRLKQNKFDLFEIINGKNKKISDKRLRQPIMGTDLTYEDLAFRFLYWPNPKIVGEQTIKLQPCYKIRLVNPGQGGDYSIIYLSVHKKYNALMQVVGYNRAGKILKRFHVTELMKVGKGQTLKKMNVETYNPKTGKAIGITYLEFKKPQPVRKGLR